MATEITMTNGETFTTSERLEDVIQKLERRSYTEVTLDDGSSVRFNPAHVVYVRVAASRK